MPKGIKKGCTRPIPTREWLEQKYLLEGLTNVQLAALTGYSRGGIANLIWRLGLAQKGVGGAQRLRIDRDTLYRLHVVEGLTAVRIAAMLGCNNGTISRYIKRWGLDPGRALVNVRKDPPASRDVLWKMYWVDRMSLSQIGRQFDRSPATTRRWFEAYDIPRHRWNGGEVHRTYIRGPVSRRDGNAFGGWQRDAIFRRDEYQCQMPGCGSREQLEANHIVPIRCGGKASLVNGITLCRKCHVSIHNREMDFRVLFDQIIKAKRDD